MAERKLKYLLKAPIALWLGSAALAGALCAIWRLSGSWVWFGLAVAYACVLGFLNMQAVRKFAWTYAGLWVFALFSVSYAREPFLVAGISIFWAGLLFLFLGVIQVRFH